MKRAVYCDTRNVYGDMETAAKSFVANSDVDVAHFLTEDEEFPRELPGIAECRDVSGQTFFPLGGGLITSRNGTAPKRAVPVRPARVRRVPGGDIKILHNVIIIA